MMPTITPNRPSAEPKISTTKILTNSVEFWASDSAQLLPTMPTHILQGSGGRVGDGGVEAAEAGRRAGVCFGEAAVRDECGGSGAGSLTKHKAAYSCAPKGQVQKLHTLLIVALHNPANNTALLPRTHPHTRLLKPQVMPAPKMA